MRVAGLDNRSYKNNSFGAIKNAQSILKPLTDKSRTATNISAQQEISNAKELMEKLRKNSDYWRKHQQS